MGNSKSTKLKVKGILFDLDGTIMNPREAYLEAAKTAFTRTGQKIPSDEILYELPRRLEQQMPIDDLVKSADKDDFRRIYLKAFYDITATKTKPLPEIAKALQKLSENAKLALTTMRSVPKEKILEELGRFGLAQYFEVVVTSLDTKTTKPSPEALLTCSAKLGLDIGECVAVGDSVVDVRAGRNAGAKTVAVLTGTFSRKELQNEKPDLILESVKELPDFLRQPPK